VVFLTAIFLSALSSLKGKTNHYEKLLLISICAGMFLLAHAQKQVTGTVTDAKDSTPLAGVSIKLKGTTRGTLTDANGEFKISVPNNAVLDVSIIGYANKEVPVGDQSSLSITLAQGENVVEGVVVTTALGLKRTRNQLPYSTQQVAGSDISKTRGDNFVSSLSGKVSGLEIRQSNTLGGSTNVVLRGFKSLTGNNQALFVVDGVPFDNSNTNTDNQVTGRGGFDYGSAAADINPDDIETINVLKGACCDSSIRITCSKWCYSGHYKKRKERLGHHDQLRV
jgi:outer membrane receptor protein involved in Fe transport